MAFFPRYTNTFGADFAPLFRLLDEGLSDVHRSATRHSSVRAFSPRFDVKEHKDSYTLDGELPGIDQNNIDIEFTDPHTLVIKGRTESSYTSGTPPAAVEDATSTKTAAAIEPTAADSSDASSQKSSSNSHHATVEDEDAPAAETSSEVAATPAPTNKGKEVSKPATESPKSKSWISERSVGEFHRSFSFPNRVDQDAVKASLKNGILSIVVPKAKAPESRRINIE